MSFLILTQHSFYSWIYTDKLMSGIEHTFFKCQLLFLFELMTKTIPQIHASKETALFLM